jgi:hypothetical protein
MSDDIKKPEGESAPDELKNLKAEFNRKLGNVEQTLKDSNAQLLAQMQQMLKPKVQEPVREGADLEDLFYKDPKAYAAKIEERTIQAMDSRIAQRETVNAQRNNVIAQLSREFPELSVDDHELTQLALKKYNELAKESGATPATYKAAVYEAALEQGIKPRSKRPDSDDSFSLSGSGSGKRSAKKTDELDPGVAETAIAFGVDPERVKARMKNSKHFKMIKR